MAFFLAHRRIYGFFEGEPPNLWLFLLLLFSHAQRLCNYQVLRQGTLRLPAPEAPPSHSWPSALAAFEAALAQEERLLVALRRLACAAQKEGDEHLAHFLVDAFVEHQVGGGGRVRGGDLTLTSQPMLLVCV